eukprot:TRINITY_DN258_c0_g3_i1.p1 TRINITY_DN258_c0_g3~~TRINITY_DN258_c0_g3_i1.p1  ORF type:complete len:679 (-),score=192.05 TRINITY_DN258_c0_g3_i1:71-2107(-)
MERDADAPSALRERSRSEPPLLRDAPRETTAVVALGCHGTSKCRPRGGGGAGGADDSAATVAAAICNAGVWCELRAARRQLERERNFVLQLQAEAAAREAQFAEARRVAEHVDAEIQARRAAEAEANLARGEAAEACAAKEQRYEDLQYLVSQVDLEIAARREAEAQLADGRAEAAASVADALAQAAAAAAREREVREVAARCEQERLDTRARLEDLEAQLEPLRTHLEKANSLADERSQVNASLREQLEAVLAESAARAAALLDMERHLADTSAALASAQEALAEQRRRGEELEERLHTTQEKLEQVERSLSDLDAEHVQACDLLKAKCEELEAHVTLEEGLRGELLSLGDQLRRADAKLSEVSGEATALKERARTAATELEEGQGSAVASFLYKFPAAAALVVVLRHLLVCASGLEPNFSADGVAAAVRACLGRRGAGSVTRYELDQFLVDDVGVSASDVHVFAQALFAVLDLERHGVLSEALLVERLENPPSMKDVWLADLPCLWPGRSSIVQFARTGKGGQAASAAAACSARLRQASASAASSPVQMLRSGSPGLLAFGSARGAPARPSSGPVSSRVYRSSTPSGSVRVAGAARVLSAPSSRPQRGTSPAISSPCRKAATPTADLGIAAEMDERPRRPSSASAFMSPMGRLAPELEGRPRSSWMSRRLEEMGVA